MDLEKALPLTILAVVAVLSVAGMVLMYNSDATGMAVGRPAVYSRVLATGKEPFKISTWGHAIAAAKPRMPCHILSSQGDLYDLSDVPTYLSADQYNDLSVCYPYYDLYQTNTDQVCCVV